MIFSVKTSCSSINKFPAIRVGHIFMETVTVIREHQRHIQDISGELNDVKLAFADFMIFQFTKERAATTTMLVADPNAGNQAHQAIYPEFRGNTQQSDLLFAQVSRDQQAWLPVLVSSFEKSLPRPTASPWNVWSSYSTLKPAVQFLSLYARRRISFIVNLRKIPNLKSGLELRNLDLSGKIECVSQIYSKPNSSRGHALCRAVKPKCDKCAGFYRTKECSSPILKCANCGGDHTWVTGSALFRLRRWRDFTKNLIVKHACCKLQITLQTFRIAKPSQMPPNQFASF
ncbi:hypothetical protein DAPPUDRAFT_109842 [Daphnia pulex]|uniref:Uncharacterized protein n=1 Tax=Daphnia pulex TaxID=6669 RepID=E9H4D6_DAPPU|nr:hypothetical protein DAPPUDRAFT_109842 [Daphnia pulex]|eukprot:EFX73362.1 hypothetical protein DAPPUDRAFT_109842 [Daphnia pulex]